MPIWTSKAAQYWIVTITGAISLLTFLLLRDVVSISSLARIQALQIDAAPSSTTFQAFELEGLSITTPFPGYPDSLSESQRLEWLLTTLNARLQSLSDTPERPACKLNLKRYASILKPLPFGASRLSSPISFAINLKNSQHVLPTQIEAIVTAMHYLRPYRAIYLSIFENDSEDTTPLLLAELAAALERLGIDGLFISSSRLRSGMTVANRIDVLAEVRNAALRPLLPYARGGEIVFINDIVLCAADILELLLQQHIQSADVALGVDWADSEVIAKPWVYDAWVLRGINGEMVYQRHRNNPFPVVPPDGRDWLTHAFSTQSTDIHTRWLSNLPFPIYSGWGGIVCLKADLFVDHGIRFRSTKATGWTGGTGSGLMRKWGKLVTDKRYLAGDCPGDSECGLIMRDIWNVRNGQARVVLASQVNTAYSMHTWRASRMILPFVPRENKVFDEEIIDWTTVTIPAGVICMPTRTENGTPHDAHDQQLFRYLMLDPLYEATANANAAYD